MSQIHRWGWTIAVCKLLPLTIWWTITDLRRQSVTPQEFKVAFFKNFFFKLELGCFRVRHLTFLDFAEINYLMIFVSPSLGNWSMGDLPWYPSNIFFDSLLKKIYCRSSSGSINRIYLSTNTMTIVFPPIVVT